MTPGSSRRGAADRDNPRPERQVNTLLHTLRGEQFRHQQNLLGSQSHIATSLQSKPTLPLAQIFGSSAGDPYEDTLEPVQPAPFRAPGVPGHRHPPVTLVEGVPTYAYPNGAVPGPRPPRSWTSLFDEDERRVPAWRAGALHVLFEDLRAPGWVYDVEEGGEGGGMVVPLALDCARVLLAAFGDTEDWAEVAQYIPGHVKKDLVRWCAVRRPLSSAKLYALCGEEGHAEGELLVIGPEATLKRSALAKDKGKQVDRRIRAAHPPSGDDTADGTTSCDADDFWDAPGDTATPLTTLALTMTPLPHELLSYLPPTLTHLALVALPQPAQIWRLPEMCPLLEALDLSYNDWFSGAAPTSEGSLDRVVWRRWRYLRVLGLRGCGIGVDIVSKVNAKRWTDVDIIGLGEPVSTSTLSRSS